MSDDENFKLPFVNVTYGGHPAAASGTGAVLAQVLVTFMTDVMGFTAEQIQAGILGGAFDGAYLGNGGLNVSVFKNMSLF